MPNTTKHTPGPWMACRDTTEEHGRIIKDAAGEHLAAIPYWGDHQYEMNANARLIAAAPDLLEALEDAMRKLAAYAGISELPEQPLWFKCSHTKQLRALTKARGEG